MRAMFAGGKCPSPAESTDETIRPYAEKLISLVNERSQLTVSSSDSIIDINPEREKNGLGPIITSR